MTYYDRDKPDAQPSMAWPKPHHGSTAEYGTSAWPFVSTGDIDAFTPSGADPAVYVRKEIKFKNVTRWIQITSTHTTSGLKLSFEDPGISAEPITYFDIPSGTTTPRLEIKCTKIYISSSSTGASSYSLIAGLTAIDESSFPDISGLDGISHSS
jgi:hypothetical protein